MNNKYSRILFLCAMTMAISGYATEYFVPDGSGNSFHCMMTNALSRMTQYDILTIREGTYQLNDGEYMYNSNAKESTAFVVNANDVTVRGDPAVSRDKVVIRGANKRGFYSVNRRCRIENLTMENFSITDMGGAFTVHQIAINSGNSTHADLGVISNCVFHGCTGSYGGAIAGATLIDCVLSNNTATARGGAASSVKLYGCDFFNNSAADYGGAAHTVYYATNCTFTGNSVTAKYDGGAIHGSNSDVEVIACKFYNNTAFRWGGVSLNCHLIKCFFGAGNTAPQRGNIGYNSNFTDCAFTGNQASDGGIYERCIFTNMTVTCVADNAGQKPKFKNCLFADNKANKRLSPGVLEMVNCTVVGNASGGSNLFSFNKDAVIKNNLFYNNTKTAGRDDAFLSVATGGTPTIDHNGYGVTTFFGSYGDTNAQLDNVKFLMDGANPYRLALRNDSMVKAGGDATIWTASDVDLAGKPRLHADPTAVGLGCYECWERSKGFEIILY